MMPGTAVLPWEEPPAVPCRIAHVCYEFSGVHGIGSWRALPPGLLGVKVETYGRASVFQSGQVTHRVAITRAAHLLDYLAVMRRIGAPVDRDLARSPLPAFIESAPDLYVSVPLVIEWLAHCGRDVYPMELGFLAAQNASMASLRPSHQAAILGAQTGLARMQAVLRIAHLEDSAIRTSLRSEAEHVRIFCDMDHLQRHPFICFAEWLNLHALISVFRSVAGPTWHPVEMCFVSRLSLPDAVLEAFPNTRLLMGQPHTSILVDRMDLARPTEAGAHLPDNCAELLSPEGALGALAEGWTFKGLLERIMQPYLNDTFPDLASTAEMVGMSKRTLQRRLRENGLSYSDILKAARFDLARTLLNDPDMRIIDVAMTSGYDNPQHFSRAFRHFTGVTPTDYRRQLARGRENMVGDQPKP